MKTWVLATAAIVVGLLIAAAAWRAGFPPGQDGSAIGGPFHLVDQNGARVDQRLLKGRWSAVYFGYTFCPDACPTTLSTLAQAIGLLGARARPLQVIFITVDPERDTPTQLKTYLSSPSFPPGTIGLTGSPAEVAAAARAYKVYFRKAGGGATYAVDHTSIVYLMDPRGRFARPIGYGLSPQAMADQIAQAMAGR